jgi:hypothetical protein
MEIQDAYKQKMAAQLKVWSRQISLLEAKMENVEASMKVKRTEQLQELRAKQQVASEKISELGKASGEAWDQVKITADKVWDDLKTGLADAQSKFK